MNFSGRRFALQVVLLSALVALVLGASLMAGEAPDDGVLKLINKPDRPMAPSFDGAVAWINTDKPLTTADLKGKIVLLDFWTFG